MKLLKISLLINYFSIAKNSRRAIFMINLGIFFSIFAFTAASVSLYIENKVSNLEFTHIENSRFKREMESASNEIILYRNQLRQMVNSEETYEQYIEFLRLNNFGKSIVSPNDLHALSLYEFTTDKEFFSEFASFLDDAIDYNYLSKKDKQDIKTVFSNLINSFEKLKNLDNQLLKKIVFDRSYSELGDEILKSLKNKSNLKFLRGQGEYAKEYKEIIKTTKDIDKLFVFFLRYSNTLIVQTDDSIDELNKQIINLSNKEKNIILLAFILQLIIFIIIQFFEISSVNLNFKKKK